MATKITFLTVPIELQNLAHSCHDSLRGNGRTLRIEFAEHDFPESATVYCRGKGEEHFFLVEATVKQGRVKLWSAFGRSRDGSAFVSLCVPSASAMRAATLAFLRDQGVGLYTVDEKGVFARIVEPKDLTLAISLPPLAQQKSSARKALVPIYAQFDNGDWQRGFEEACKVVETFARRRLANEARAGMVEVPGKKGVPKKVGVKEINGKPLGALADVFCRKLTQTHVDSVLCGGLKKINPDRVDVAHAKLNGAKKKKLRKKVSQHMWTIHNMLRALTT